MFSPIFADYGHENHFFIYTNREGSNKFVLPKTSREFDKQLLIGNPAGACFLCPLEHHTYLSVVDVCRMVFPIGGYGAENLNAEASIELFR
jgi:hypothetical protein